MSGIETIMSEINGLTQDAGEMKYYTCGKCGATKGSNTRPNTCNSCETPTPFFYEGATKEESKDTRAKALRDDLLKNKTEPKKAETKKAETKEAEPEPKVIVKKETKPTTKKKKTTPTKEVKSAAPETKAEREKATKAFIKELKLNEIQPVEVGQAVVQTVGFTIWVDKLPTYRFYEPIESAQDFMAAYNAVRAEQPATRIDVAECAKCTNEELNKLLFRGELIASLNNGQGTLRVQPGDTVTIGALKTPKGNLRFVVI